MLAQIVEKVLPLITRRLIEQSPVCAIDSKPHAHVAEQRTHTREWKSEVSECLAVTGVDDVDCVGSFSNDRSSFFADDRRSDWRKARELPCPQFVFIRTNNLCQQRKVVIDSEDPDHVSQRAPQQRNTVKQRLQKFRRNNQPELLHIRRLDPIRCASEPQQRRRQKRIHRRRMTRNNWTSDCNSFLSSLQQNLCITSWLARSRPAT